MKTSNKLLIAFAAALIIVPILSMVYISKAYYIDGKSWSNLQKQNETFDGVSENMKAIPLSQFNSINIVDGKEVGLYIYLIKDKKFGVKVNKNDKDDVNFSVDNDGKLQIQLKNQNKEYRFINIFVYAPDTKSLSATNVSSLELNAKGDSLAVSLKKFEQLRFASNTKFEKLNINTEGGYINVDGVSIAKSVNLNLKNANFRSAGTSFEDLNIASTGKSEIDVFGGNSSKEKYSVKNLTLKTVDSANVSFRSIAILDTRGSLSDQTTVQLPVSSLRQLIK